MGRVRTMYDMVLGGGWHGGFGDCGGGGGGFDTHTAPFGGDDVDGASVVVVVEK